MPENSSNNTHNQQNSLYNKILSALPYFFGLYLIAILSTMAGMEIFGWLTALTVLILLALNKIKPHQTTRCSIGPDWALIGFFIVGCIGVFTNNLWQTQGTKMIGSLRWAVLLYLVYFAIQQISANGIGQKTSAISEKHKKFFFGFILFWSVFAGVYGIIQFLTGIDLAKGVFQATDHATGYKDFKFWRTKGLFGMPLTYAYSYGMFTAITLGLLLRKQFVGTRRTIALIGVLALSGSIITTYARGGWLGLMASTSVLLFLGLNRRRFLQIAIPVGAAISLIVAFSGSLQQRLFSIFDMQAKGSTIRFDLWRANFEMFLDHPFFGVGYRQPGHVVKTYFEKLGIDDGMIGAHAHSTYFEVLSGTGALGFICYAGFSLTFFIFTIRLWRKLRHDSDSLARPAEETSLQSSPSTNEIQSLAKSPEEIRKTNLLHSGLVLGALGAQIHFHIGGLTEAVFFDAEVNHLLMVIWAMVAYLYGLHFKQSTKHAH